ncbi:hypothetical protein ACFW04_014277 [Cataglyphis niger]
MNKENTNLISYDRLHVNLLLEHSCFQHYNDEKHLLHIDDNNVASINIQTSNGDYNEVLVNPRPALYDRMTIKERFKRKALWNEVAILMGDTFLQVIILFQIYGDLSNLSRFSELPSNWLETNGDKSSRWWSANCKNVSTLTAKRSEPNKKIKRKNS